MNQRFFTKRSVIKEVGLCLLSAGLLILSFPRADIGILAWIGLVPLFFVLEGKRSSVAFFIGYLTGVIFFAGTQYWLVHVTILGMILLILYLGIYFGLFAMGVRLLDRKPVIVKFFLFPSLWVVLEFLRGSLMTGFGWGSLGLSQYKNLPFIQIADITGVAGISFLIVMVNFFLKELLVVKGILTVRGPFPVQQLFGIVTTIFVVVLGYGIYRVQEPQGNSQLSSIKIMVIQANIPQEMKWLPSVWQDIMNKYLALTQEATSEKPDLIIWPETSFPGFLWESQDLFVILEGFVKGIKIPLLFGAIIQENDDYYNSAILLSKEGEVMEQYDKIHLVPFGEYIPFRRYCPILTDIVPIGDFTAGGKWTLFPVGVLNRGPQPQNHFFSVLICFEDTFAYLARQFSQKGASLLVNITNDAWFLDTSEPFMHLQSSVFRAIENRKSLVRAANTGVSCFIDKRGRIFNPVQDHQHKKTYVAGFSMGTVELSQQRTFYTKFGDIFTYLCFGCILWGIIMVKSKK